MKPTELELPAGASAQDAWSRLVGDYPALEPRRGSLAAAVNRRYVGFDARLAPGDELVFIPPIAGSAAVLSRVSRRPGWSRITQDPGGYSVPFSENGSSAASTSNLARRMRAAKSGSSSPTLPRNSARMLGFAETGAPGMVK